MLLNPFRYVLAAAPTEDVYWPNVEMLLHFSGAADSTVFTDSKGLRTLTPFGTAKISSGGKFGSGGSFDASGDYLTVSPVIGFASGDFTIEWWVKFESTLLVQPILSSRTGAAGYQVFSSYGSGQLRLVWQQWGPPSYTYEVLDVSVAKTVGSWVAVCFERVGDVLTAYADGVSVGTLTTTVRPASSATCHIGQDSGTPSGTLNGLIDELRVTKGVARYGANYSVATAPFPNTGVTDPHFAYVTYLLHMGGSNGSTSFIDSSPVPRTTTANGSVAISTAQSKFGGTSAAFNGTSDFLTSAVDPAFDLGTGDFTIEFFVRLAGYSSAYAGAYGAAIVSTYKGTGGGTPIGWQVRINGTASSYTTVNVYTGTTDLNFSSSFSLNTWYHVAVSRVEGQLRVFVDGVQAGATVANSDSFTASTATSRPLYIGRLNDATYLFYLNGHLDELRITKGVGRYDAPFTAPAFAFPDTVTAGKDMYWPYVSCLLHMDGVDTSTTLVDQKGGTWTAANGAQIRTDVFKFGGGALLLDGSNDKVTRAHSAEFSFGNGEFAIEFWFYCGDSLNAGTSQKVFVSKWGGASTSDWMLDYSSGNLRGIYMQNNTVYTVHNAPVTFTAGNWYHIAWTRVGSTSYIFVDGVLQTTQAISLPMKLTTQVVLIGFKFDGTTIEYLNGRIDDLRITKGIGRYSATFPLPTAPYPDS